MDIVRDVELIEARRLLRMGWRFVPHPEFPRRWLLIDLLSKNDGWNYSEERMQQIKDASR